MPTAVSAFAILAPIHINNVRPPPTVAGERSQRGSTCHVRSTTLDGLERLESHRNSRGVVMTLQLP